MRWPREWIPCETGDVRRRSTGFTLVEVAVSSVIVALIFGAVWSIWVGVSLSSHITGAHLEALQSVMIASQALRNDLDVMYYSNLMKDGKAQGGNLSIDGEGTRLSFHVPRNLDSMSWRVDLVPVSYYLRPTPQARESYELIREVPGEQRALAGCVLGGINFSVIPPGGLVPYRMFLQVTLEGLDRPDDRARFPSSFLIPIHRKLPPAAYLVDPSGVRVPYPES